MKTCFLLLFFAQEGQIDLRRCVEMALRADPSLQVARFEPWIEEAAWLGQWGEFDPVLFGSASIGSSEQRIFSALSNLGSPLATLEQDQQEYLLGIRKRFPLGAAVEATVRAAGIRSNSPVFLLNPSWESSVGLTVTYPILRGAGSETNLATIQVRQKNHEASLESFAASVEQTVLETERAYYDLMLAFEERRLAEQALELARRLVRETEQKLQAGVRGTRKIDLTQAQAQEASEQRNLLRAEYALASARDRLKRLIDPGGLTVGSAPFPYRPSPLPERSEVPLPVEDQAIADAYREALQNRPDLRALRRRAEAAQSALVAARGQARARFDLFTRARLIGNDETVEDGFRRAFRGDGWEALVGATFEVPVENLSLFHAAQRAELEFRKAEAAVRAMEIQILVEVRDAVRAIRMRQESLRVSREFARQAEERHRIEETLLAAGESTTFFLLQARQQWVAAQIEELRARIDLELAHSMLKRARGTLLSFYGIHPEDHLRHDVIR